MGMHFKLGLYEHQSAGAIAGLDRPARRSIPSLLADPAAIERIRITIYEPAFSIIGDPHKRDPRTRQSADHSMVYIVATLLRKAVEAGGQGSGVRSQESAWKALMLVPDDYDDAALLHPLTRRADGSGLTFGTAGRSTTRNIPMAFRRRSKSSIATLGTLSSGLVMYPEGHARNTSGNLAALLEHKFRRLAGLGVRDVDGAAAAADQPRRQIGRPKSATSTASRSTMFGLLNIDKPAGITSRDVVNRVQRLVQAAQGRPRRHARSAGHRRAGRCGRSGDAAGRIRAADAEDLSRRRFSWDGRAIRKMCKGPWSKLPNAPHSDAGEIEAILPQISRHDPAGPPAYSALKVAGQRAYEMARRGEVVELAARPVEIHAIEIVRYEYPELELLIRCGSGTYIRSLGRDIAEAFGTRAPLCRRCDDWLWGHFEPTMECRSINFRSR